MNPHLKLNSCLMVAVALSLSAAHSATFTVINTNDAGQGSFRQAILDANAHPGADVIQFNIPGPGVHTIAPLTPLPEITNSVSIDGYSQPGSSSNTLADGNDATLLIRLDGYSITNGFPIGLKFSGAGGSTLRGLIIIRFYTGIQLYASSGNTIAGNWIGIDADNLVRANGGTGIEVTCAVFNRSTANLIGGTNPGDRNVISGNRVGITFFPTSADHNTVQGNFIGTDATGALPRGNFFEGVEVQGATNIVIGGSAPGARNLICGNATGISLLGSSGDVIQGNYIGTDVTAHYDLGNDGDGIVVQGTPSVTIGGVNAGNVICNNSGNGVLLLGADSNSVLGNFIGTTPVGWPMGNGRDGVGVQGSAGVIIGTQVAGAGNVIHYNNGSGVNIQSGGSNAISANSIFDNAGLGILLGTTANQPQSVPVVTSTATAYGSTQVQGTLAGQPNATYRMEFFASPPWDPTWTPEGKTYLGSAAVPTDGTGAGAFSVTLPVSLSAGDLVTATATDAAGNTSQFSLSAPAVVNGPATVSLAIAGDNNGQTVSWPKDASGFRLELANSLSPSAQWLPVTNGITDDGTLKRFAIPSGTAATNQFFRLRRL